VRRRVLLAAAGGTVAAAPLMLRAQAGAPRRVGILTPALQQQRAAQLIEGLGELGWQQGRNLAIELRVGEEGPLLDMQAAELVQQHVDVIVALLTPAVLAARRATEVIE
jgi:putative ABC transport system substrate-binding protein